MKTQTPYFCIIMNGSGRSLHSRADFENDARLLSENQNGSTTESVFQTDNGLQVTVRRTQTESGAVKQVCAVQNITEQEIRLSGVSSLYLPKIGAQEGSDWSAEGRFILHYCQNAWQGEGQWMHQPIGKLGLYPTYNHSCYTAATFSYVGSWTTSKYYPLFLLEDTVLGKTWFFEPEAVGSWFVEISAHDENPANGLDVYVSCAHDQNDGWTCLLKPQESYTAQPAFFGEADGGFEEGLRVVTKYKRESAAARWANGVIPVCFNDYMDCLWGMPSAERDLPLIEAAAKAGVEIFCMDAGWYGNPNDKAGREGDYTVADFRFGDIGLKGVLDTVRAKGMRPGVWLELECCNRNTLAYRKFEKDGFLTRYGDLIGSNRAVFDFRKEAVRTHFRQIIARLYEMGVRYIKNDYNQSIGIGCDGEKTLGDGLRATQEAFLAFIREIKATYPDMIIENCGSGAMRSQHAFLSEFWLQSVSDQEFSVCNPSVVSGSIGCYAPEKAGIWAYPYAVMYKDRLRRDVPTTEEMATWTDGYETVGNMVTAMLGCMYLSGRIDLCDAKNAALIRESIAVYRNEVRERIPQSYPVYPQGTFRIAERGVHSFGLLHEDRNSMILAVWNLSNETEAEIDLQKYFGNAVRVRKLYPSLPEIGCESVGSTVRVRFPEKRTGVLLLAERV